MVTVQKKLYMDNHANLTVQQTESANLRLEAIGANLEAIDYRGRQRDDFRTWDSSQEWQKVL